MAFPTPIFAGEDWMLVWLWPTIMAVTFSFFLRGRSEGEAAASRSIGHRLIANFILFGTAWVPFQIVRDAVKRGAELQGFTWPVAWGFVTGLIAMLVIFTLLLVIAIRVEAARNWFGFHRKPFNRAGRA